MTQVWQSILEKFGIGSFMCVAGEMKDDVQKLEFTVKALMMKDPFAHELAMHEDIRECLAWQTGKSAEDISATNSHVCRNMVDPKFSMISKSRNKYTKNQQKVACYLDTETSKSRVLAFA